MRYKAVLLTLGIVCLFPGVAHSAHVIDRAIYQTDVKTASGTSVFSFPVTHPTASRACTFNSDGEAVSSNVTDTELGYVSGVTSAIQTQLNGKQATLTLPLGISQGGSGQTTANAALNAFLPSQSSNSGKFLTTNGTNSSWATVTSGGSPGGSGTQIQYRVDASTFGGTAGSSVDNTAQKVTLTGGETSIGGASSFSAVLLMESLPGAPSGSANPVYGPRDNNSGSGTENPSYTGYNANDSVDALVYSYRNDLGGGTLYVSPAGIPLGNVTLVNNPSGIDWSWGSTTNGDGSTPSGYIIVVTDNTTATSYSYDVGVATSYADMNVGGTVSYTAFSGFTSSGQTITYTPYLSDTSPAGGAYYNPGSPYFAVDGQNNGSLFAVSHSITAGGAPGWRIFEDVSNATFDGSGTQSFIEFAQFSGPATTTPNHYGTFADGSALTVDYSLYATDGVVYSPSPANQSTTDPNDGNYYYYRFTFDTPASSVAGKMIDTTHNQGQVYNESPGSHTEYRDAIAPAFSAGTTITPSILSNTPLELKNSSGPTSWAPQLILNSTGTPPDFQIGMQFKNSSILKGSIYATANGDLTITPHTNRSVLFRATAGSTNAPSVYFQDSGGVGKLIIGTDGNIDIGPSGAGNFWLNVPSATTAKTQMRFVQSTSIPSPAIAGGFRYDGEWYGTDSQERRFIRSSTANALTQNSFPIPDSNGHLIDSSLTQAGGIIVANILLEAKQGITMDASKNLDMGNNARITANVGWTYNGISANTTLGPSHHVVNVTANSITVTLPTAVSISGREYIVHNSGSGTVTINTTSSQTIDGAVSGAITFGQYHSRTFISDGANWIITSTL